MGHYHLFSRVVRPTGNVVVERVIRTLKEDVVWLHDWDNNRRLLEPIGYVPQVEYEAAYYRGQQSQAMVA